MDSAIQVITDATAIMESNRLGAGIAGIPRLSSLRHLTKPSPPIDDHHQDYIRTLKVRCVGLLARIRNRKTIKIVVCIIYHPIHLLLAPTDDKIWG